MKVLTWIHLGVLCFLLLSCCDEDIEVIGNGTMIACTDIVTRDQITTIKTPFSILVEFEVLYSELQEFSLFPKAYAQQCFPRQSNGLIPEKSKLYLDKDFVFQDDTIKAGYNLLLLDELKIDHSYYYVTRFDFTFDFLLQSEFANEEYTYFLEAETTNGLYLENELTLMMDLP